MNEDIAQLIGRVSLRDRAAFRMLYAATSAKLFGICLRILSDRAEAEDALQEVFVRVWNNADRYSAAQASPMSWLVAIARNHAIDRIRVRRPGTADIDEALDLASEGPTPEEAAMAGEDRSRLSSCLAELEAARADAVRAAYIEGYSYQELAERHGVPVNTMRTWLRRSLLKLRECLTR